MRLGFWFKFNVRGHAPSGLFSNPGKIESGHVVENPKSAQNGSVEP